MQKATSSNVSVHTFPFTTNQKQSIMFAEHWCFLEAQHQQAMEVGGGGRKMDGTAVIVKQKRHIANVITHIHHIIISAIQEGYLDEFCKYISLK